MNGEGDLWLADDGAGDGPPHRSRRLALVLSSSVLCLAAIGVPVGLLLASGGPSPSARTARQGHRAGPAGTTHRLARGPAYQRVIAALNATTGSGSYDVTYQFAPPTPPTHPTTTTTAPPCLHIVVGGTSNGVSAPPPTRVVCSGSGGSNLGTKIDGHGVVNTDPFAMETVSQVGGLGQITTFDNGTDLWELGGGNYGLSAGSGRSGPGSPLSGFAGLVEGTLGPRQGAFALLGLASPTGYLDLDQREITGGDRIGTGTVDGTPVTVYEITLDANEQASLPGLTPEESTTIDDALQVLGQQGYTGETVKVSIDASGFIRQTQGTATFSDGSTILSESTFSNFGCAGTIVMPGQSGSSAPPADCVSPDTGTAPPTTSTTTTTPAPSSTTTTPAPSSTTTTTTPSSTTTTTTPSSTTTTPAPSSTTTPASTTTSGARTGTTSVTTGT